MASLKFLSGPQGVSNLDLTTEVDHDNLSLTQNTSSGDSVAKLNNDVFVLQLDGQFSYEKRAVPTLPSSRHVLIRVLTTGICGSDVHYWQHGRIGKFVVHKPIVLGHESAGRILKCGSDVKFLKPGDNVAIEPGVPCRTCDYCRGGKYNLCDEMQFAATPPVDGTLATYYTVPEDFCYVLPPHVSIEEGALVEPLSIAVHCVKLASVSPGQTVLVLGAGPIGLLCCAVAKALGASVIAVADIVVPRLDFARDYAATCTYQMQDKSAKENAASIILQCGLTGGADVVIDATGAESCISCGIHVMKKGGTFIQAGLGRSEIVFPVGEICSKEGIYKTSFRYGPGDYKLAVSLLDSRKVSVKALITHSYDFSCAEEAFAGVARQEGIKTIIYGPRV